MPPPSVMGMNTNVGKRTKDKPELTGHYRIDNPQHFIESRNTPRPPITTTHKQKPSHANSGQNPRPQLVSHGQ